MKRLIALALVLLPVGAEAAARRPLVAEATVLAEWGKAENRRACAPLAFATDGAGGGRARRAQFGGGWGVAFDRPGLRSAYGLAGTGLLPEDSASFAEQRDSLARQWPYGRELPGLRAGAFAGYGLEGAKPLAAGDGDGRGQNLLAYVRVPGQRCLYNVWSRLGRRHLELLLDGLRPVPAVRR